MKTLALLFAASALLGAQEFEVASVRPAKDDGNRDNDVNQGRWVAHNLTLRRLISMAYDVDEDAVVGGPAWVGGESFDINAKIPAEYPKWTQEQFRQQDSESHQCHDGIVRQKPFAYPRSVKACGRPQRTGRRIRFRDGMVTRAGGI
jgi:hypothetical protein